MLRRTQPRKPNGHAVPNGRPNGHGPAIVERGGVPEPACPSPSSPAPAGVDRAAGNTPGLAASDDASGPTVASSAAFAAASSLQTQACTTREEYAAAAPPPPPSQEEASPEKIASKKAENAEDDSIPPGASPLPADPADFVEEIHRKVDLAEIWCSLLRANDLKIRQRAVERVTDLKYKGAATSGEEPQQQVILDIDSAVARRAAEGAKK